MIDEGSYPSRCFISMLAISVASRQLHIRNTSRISYLLVFICACLFLVIHTSFAMKSLILCPRLLLQSVSSVVALIHVFHYFIRIVFDRSHDRLLRVQHGLPSVSFILRAYRFYASHTSNPFGGLRSKRISTSEQCW